MPSAEDPRRHLYPYHAYAVFSTNDDSVQGVADSSAEQLAECCIWVSEADSLDSSLSRFLEDRIRLLPGVSRVRVHERQRGESKQIQIWTFLAKDDRRTRERVHEVEEQLHRQFPGELFEFHAHLAEEDVTPG